MRDKFDDDGRHGLLHTPTKGTAQDISDGFDDVPVATKKRPNIRDGIKHDYTCPQKLSRSKRSRHFLAWSVKNYAGDFVSYSLIYMAINGYTKVLASNSREVQSLRNSAGSIRRALKEWGMFLVSAPARDGSVRATFDATDAAKTELDRRAKNHARTGHLLKEVYDLIDVRQITDSKLRAWVMTSVASIVKTIPSMEKKLLGAPGGAGSEDK